MSAQITVIVAETKGSAPRSAGAMMQVWADRVEGSIGGGALEWAAICHARAMLVSGQQTDRTRHALGPDMGQCCGGAVVLEFAARPPQERALEPVWIWGAGHVGRAVASVLSPMERYALTLVDVAADRFPAQLPAQVAPLVAADPVRAVRHAPVEAPHLVVTYSHDLDLRLCDALLRLGCGHIGLIGSATKWARFRKRLIALGHVETELMRIRCPIGDPSLGKHPQAIAVGVAAQLLSISAAPAPAKD